MHFYLILIHQFVMDLYFSSKMPFICKYYFFQSRHQSLASCAYYKFFRSFFLVIIGSTFVAGRLPLKDFVCWVCYGFLFRCVHISNVSFSTRNIWVTYQFVSDNGIIEKTLQSVHETLHSCTVSAFNCIKWI